MSEAEVAIAAAEAEVTVEEYRHLARPFAPEIEAEAERIVSLYRMFVEWHAADELFYAGGAEYGYLCGHGPTREEALAMATDGLIGAVATTLEGGDEPPMPFADVDDRDEHVEVKVSAAELRELERLADRAGFRGVGDYLRHAALSRA